MRENHPGQLKVQCELCSTRFETKAQLKNHMKERHNIDPRGNPIVKVNPRCDLCGKVLSSERRLKDHMATVHQGLKKFNCRFCDKKFSSNSNKLVHEGSVHTRDLPYKCPDCPTGSQFIKKSLLVRHRHVAHGLAPPTKTAAPGTSQSLLNNQTIRLEVSSSESTKIVLLDQMDPTFVRT